MKKICKKCGKVLPKDSEFCQYCGSNEIETFEDKPIVFKRCSDCGEKLPDDSKFCQYCGSKNIDLVTQCKLNEAKSKEREKTNNNQESKNINTLADTTTKNINNNTYKILFFATLLIAVCSIIGILALSENSKISSDDSLEIKAEKYDQVLIYAKNSKGYNDFYSRQTLLYKPNNTKVWIYLEHDNTTISFETSSLDISAEWGDFSGYWVPLTISYSGTGVEYIKISNDANSEVFYITIVG